MPRMRLYWRLLRVAGVVLSGLIVAAALGLAERGAVPVSALRKQRLTQWFLARLAATLPFRVRVTGELPAQPMLWVANHVSWCDIPLLGMLAPLSFLAKAEVRAWPALGWLAQIGLFVMLGLLTLMNPADRQGPLGAWEGRPRQSATLDGQPDAILARIAQVCTA